MKVYLDTNVYLDLLENRRLAIYTQQILDRAVSCEFYIVISELVVEELSKFTTDSQIRDLIANIGAKVIIVPTTIHNDRLSGIHYPDNLHILTAVEQECDFLITNDYGFFGKALPIQTLSSQVF